MIIKELVWMAMDAALETRNPEQRRNAMQRLANVWRVVAVRYYREGHADPLKEFTEACREEQKSMLKKL
jgi:hypothetical protein